MKDIRVGFALGSGSFRGVSHIGFLHVMDANAIPVDLIAGSSIGALIGSLYCAGLKPEYMLRFLKQLEMHKIYDPVIPRTGFYKGARAQTLIRMLTANRAIEDLPVPLAVVATDINACERVVFREGKVHEAVRASISIPGVFVPHKIGGRTLVDGGVIDRVPAGVVRDMGADVVVAVDVGYCGEPRAIAASNIIDVMMRSLEILEWEAMSARVKQADVWVSPDVMHVNPMSLANIENCFQKGVEAGEKALPAIRAAIAAVKAGRRKRSVFVNMASRTKDDSGEARQNVREGTAPLQGM